MIRKLTPAFAVFAAIVSAVLAGPIHASEPVPNVIWSPTEDNDPVPFDIAKGFSGIGSVGYVPDTELPEMFSAPGATDAIRVQDIHLAMDGRGVGLDPYMVMVSNTLSGVHTEAQQLVKDGRGVGLIYVAEARAGSDVTPKASTFYDQIVRSATFADIPAPISEVVANYDTMLLRDGRGVGL